VAPGPENDWHLSVQCPMNLTLMSMASATIANNALTAQIRP
jgi:hypothetical protein